jgi:hypothetical protein
MAQFPWPQASLTANGGSLHEPENRLKSPASDKFWSSVICMHGTDLTVEHAVTVPITRSRWKLWTVPQLLLLLLHRTMARFHGTPNDQTIRFGDAGACDGVLRLMVTAVRHWRLTVLQASFLEPSESLDSDPPRRQFLVACRRPIGVNSDPDSRIPQAWYSLCVAKDSRQYSSSAIRLFRKRRIYHAIVSWGRAPSESFCGLYKLLCRCRATGHVPLTRH